MVVQSHYGLSAVAVDPPKGCQLCHLDDNGGMPATLRPFGRLLYTQFGVMAYDEPSLKSALTALDSQQPQLADIIKNAGDPNNPGAAMASDGGSPFATVGGVDPVPGYGCTIGRARSAPLACWAIGALGLATALRRRRRR